MPDGGRIHYVRISPGTGYTDAVLEHTATPTKFYKSKIKWNGKGWDLTLKDGTVYVFGESAPLQAIRDRNGNQLSIIRASGQSGNIISIASPNGRWIEFSYDASNRITQAKDNSGRAVNYTYDASGRLWKVTDPAGGVTEYTYDASHRMLTVKDPRGNFYVTNQYDANGRVTTQTQADATTYQFAYTLDGNGKVIQTDATNPRGFVRRVTFNSSGYILTDTGALCCSGSKTYERQPGSNLVLSVTDELGRRTAFTYDAFGNNTSITRMSGTAEAVTTNFTYEPNFNLLSSVTDPLGHTTSLAYDSIGNLTSISDPLTNATTFTYNSSGQPVSIANPLGNTSRFEYDLGDPIKSTDPLGNATSRFVDAAGRVLSVTDTLGNTVRYQYDSLDRMLSQTDALGGVTSFTYDGNGNLLSVTDARGNVTNYTYNNMNRISNRQDPLLRNETY